MPAAVAATAARAAALPPPLPPRPPALRGRGARRARQQGSAGRARALPAAPGEQPDPYALLGVPRGAARAEVRRAYLALIKTLHPDVSRDGGDTTAAAAALNAAYRSILEGLQAGGSEGGGEEEADVFDAPEAEPSCLFVDPFACTRASPYNWEALQHVAEAAAAAGADPESALAEAGAGAGAGAVQYLSPRQLAVLRRELARAAAALDPLAVQAAAWFVGDCLARARVANARQTDARRRR